MKPILFLALALVFVVSHGEASTGSAGTIPGPVSTITGLVDWKLVGEGTKFEHMGVDTEDGFILLRLVGITTYNGIEFLPLEGHFVSCTGYLTPSRETLIVKSVDSCSKN